MPYFALPCVDEMQSMARWAVEKLSSAKDSPNLVLLTPYNPLPWQTAFDHIPLDLQTYPKLVDAKSPWTLSIAPLLSTNAVARTFQTLHPKNESDRLKITAGNLGFLALFNLSQSLTIDSCQELIESAISLCRRNPSRKLIKLNAMDDQGLFANLQPFQTELNEKEKRILSWLASGSLRLEMQPIVSFRGVEQDNFELLARFQAPNGDIVVAGEALNGCESAQVFKALDLAVLDRVAHAIDQLGSSKFSINVDRSCLENPKWLERLQQLLIYYPNLKDQLSVEVTERGVPLDVLAIQASVSKLQSWGVKVVIDDFGRGITTLNELDAGHIDIVKFDRQVIEAAGLNKASEQLLSEFVSAIKTYGCKTVAEGIETNETFRLAEFLGIDSFQGFLFNDEQPRLV